MSDALIHNENKISLNCKPTDWKDYDLIGLKSTSGEIVGLLQVLKPNVNQSALIETSAQNKPVVTTEGSTEAGAPTKVEVESSVSDNPAALPGGNSLNPTNDSEPPAVEQGNFLKLISVRENRFLQASDYFERLDFTTNVHSLKGTSYLWKTKVLPVNTKHLYLPLITQGETIGDTAQNLAKNEYYFTVFGTLGYGVQDTLSVSTNIANFALGSPNGKIKKQAYRSLNQTWAISINMAQERDSSEKLMNVDLMWDSILSDTLVAHSLISAAVISFDSAKEVAAIKSYGNSSIQTGYEYIFSNWNRFLIGPSYSLEQKALGGYLGYVKIINNLSIQASLTTNNVREFKFSAKEGYFFILDAYWRW